MILKSMKKWDKNPRLEDINRKQKVSFKLQKIKSHDLFEKVFLKNNINNLSENETCEN